MRAVRQRTAPYIDRLLAAVTLVVTFAVVVDVAGQPSQLPNKPGSLKFAAMGDNGTGDQPQYDVARQMTVAHETFPFDLVIMLGDNMYGSQTANDFVNKFEKPYATLLAAGVKFRASLGNHDQPTNVSYKLYNMEGQRYYTYTRNNVRFFVLDSTQMDPKQLQWLETNLRDAKEDWKICYFHHPLYSDAARHGSSVELRVMLEPIFVKYGVDVVFSGHDHVYERVKPQKGISYFVSGSAGQLRKGNMRQDNETAAYFDQDQSFMIVEI
jgi:predicted phosphodiesterase